MSEQNNNNNKNNKKPKKGNRFNLYWIYGLIILAVLALQFINLDDVPEISQKKFEQEMLLEHDVAKLEVINDKVVQVFIEPEALKNKEKYAEVRDKSFGGGINEGPHYEFQILDPGQFQERMNTIQQDWPEEQKIEIYPKTEKNWIGEILQWVLPLALLVII